MYKTNTTPTRKKALYVIGNPLIAQTMINHDETVPLQVPFRLLVIQGRDGTGSEIHYDLPSSVIAIGGRNEDASGELTKAAEILDDKIAAMVNTIVA